MKNTKYLFAFLITIGMAITLAGCFSGGKTPVRNAFMFQIHYPGKAKVPVKQAVIQVTNVQIVPQFASTEMVYRVSNLNYESDYYNIFFIPPGQQLTQIITHWLYVRNFVTDIVNNSLLNANYILQTQVLALYADYRNSSHPKAIMKIRFTLYQLTPGGERILFVKTYRSSIAIARRNAAGLVQAYSIEMMSILPKLTKQIYSAVSSS